MFNKLNINLLASAMNSAWSTFAYGWWFFVLGTLAYFIYSGVLSLSSAQSHSIGSYLIVLLIQILLGPAIALEILNITINAVRNFSFSIIGYRPLMLQPGYLRLYISYFFLILVCVMTVVVVACISAIPLVIALVILHLINASVVLTQIVTFLGVLLIVIAYFYSIFSIILSPYFLVDKREGIFSALRDSYNATNGNKLMLVVVFIGLFIFNSLGILFFLIGLLVTLPVSYLIFASIYAAITANFNNVSQQQNDVNSIDKALNIN